MLFQTNAVNKFRLMHPQIAIPAPRSLGFQYLYQLLGIWWTRTQNERPHANCGGICTIICCRLTNEVETQCFYLSLWIVWIFQIYVALVQPRDALYHCDNRNLKATTKIQLKNTQQTVFLGARSDPHMHDIYVYKCKTITIAEHNQLNRNVERRAVRSKTINALLLLLSFGNNKTNNRFYFCSGFYHRKNLYV